MHGGKNHLSHIFNYFRLDASNPTMIEEKVMLVAFVLFVVEGVIVQSKLHFNSILSNIQYPYYVILRICCALHIYITLQLSYYHCQKPFHIIVGHKSSQIQH